MSVEKVSRRNRGLVRDGGSNVYYGTNESVSLGFVHFRDQGKVIMSSQEQVSAAIVGASGYGGIQLARLLIEHPLVNVTYLGGHSSAGRKFSDIYPHLAHAMSWEVEPIDLEAIAKAADVVFLALPNGLAKDMAPVLLQKGCQVLDLSADYRFQDLEVYQTWYQQEHTDHAVAEKAVYWVAGIISRSHCPIGSNRMSGLLSDSKFIGDCPAPKTGLNPT